MPVDASSHVCLKRTIVRHDKYEGLFYVPTLNLSIIFIHLVDLFALGLKPSILPLPLPSQFLSPSSLGYQKM